MITSTRRGLLATLLPFVYERAPDGDGSVLRCHVARKNEQWREEALGEALVIVGGPDAYVSPSWYAAKREHGRVVPTWNYITAHVYGRITVHDDAEWLGAHVRRLTEKYELNRPEPWSVDDAPEPFVSGQLRAIVGVEVAVTRIEAKFKLSQNRSLADIDGVIDGLAADGASAMTECMRQVRARKAD